MDIYKNIERINKKIGEIDKTEYLIVEPLNLYGINKDYGVGIYFTKKGIISRYKIAEKDAKGRKTGDYFLVDKQICNTILYATRYIKVNNSIEMELTDGKIKVMMDNDSFSGNISFKRFIQKLNRKYWFDGSTEEVTKIHKYLNLLSKDLKLEESFSKFGWNKDKFCPYDIGVYINDHTLKSLEDSFIPKGNKDEWFDIIEKYRENIFFEAYFLASLTAPILHKLKLMPFTLHLSGKASTGKTASMIACASIYGNPEELVCSFNTTLVGLENRLNTFNHLPVFINDSQNLNNNQDTNDLIYLIFEGKGRSRGSRDDKNRTLKSWKTIVITNGEKCLLKDNAYEGANKRCIQISGESMKKEYSAKTRRIFLNNYGHLGNQWINIIKSLNVNGCYTIIDKINESIINDYNIDDNILQVTSLCLSQYLYSSKILNIEKKQAFKKAISTGLEILKLINANIKSTDMCTKIINYLKEFVMQNKLRFENDSNYERYGFLKDGNICFYNNKLDEILIDKFNYDTKLFRKEIKERNLVVLDSNGQIKQVKFDGNNGRFPQFYREVIFGEDEKVVEFKKEEKNIINWEDIGNV